MVLNPKDKLSRMEFWTDKATAWVGTPKSLVVHTFLFGGIFILPLFGVQLDTVLLVLTTAVSLEAIYLAIFIQMTINRNTESLEEVEGDIEEIQEDFRDLEGNVEDISEDIDKIQGEDESEGAYELKTKQAIDTLELDMQRLIHDIETLKKQKHLAE